MKCKRIQNELKNSRNSKEYMRYKIASDNFNLIQCKLGKFKKEIAIAQIKNMKNNISFLKKVARKDILLQNLNQEPIKKFIII